MVEGCQNSHSCALLNVLFVNVDIGVFPKIGDPNIVP